MTLVVAVPLVVAVVGALGYLAAEKAPRLAELARACMWCGLLVFLFSIAGHALKL